MATKKYLELQEYSDADLQSELDQTESQFQKLKFDHAIKGLENPLVLREVRRDIARLKGEIRRRELANADAESIANRSKREREDDVKNSFAKRAAGWYPCQNHCGLQIKQHGRKKFKKNQNRGCFK